MTKLGQREILAQPSVYCIDGKQAAINSLGRFPECHKMNSWLIAHMVGLPTVKGMIVGSWNDNTEREVRDAARRLGIGRFLLRSDKARESGRYPALGTIVESANLKKDIKWLLDMERVVYLLEPKDRFDNTYSLSVVLHPYEPAVIEVMGPGFDASDLNRGAFSPHQTISIGRTQLGTVLTPDSSCQTLIVGDREYRESRRRRLIKVGKIIAGRENGERLPNRDAIKLAYGHLISTGQWKLGDAIEYRPIPIELIRTVCAHMGGLGRRLEKHGFPGEPLVATMSFVDRTLNPVYWHIIWPKTKYDIPLRVSGD